MAKKDRFGFSLQPSGARPFWRAPHLSRRVLFRHTAAAVGGYFLTPVRPMETIAYAAPATKSTAEFCIFVLMDGAPSHIDTFDLKVGPWTPAAFRPTTINDVAWPEGLLPKLAEQFDKFALLRSVKPWATAHGLASNWLQISRNPVSVSARVAPHIGSIASLELGPTTGVRTLPTFLALNAANAPGQGYFSPEHAAFHVAPNGQNLRNTTHFDNQAIFDRRYAMLLDLDAEARQAADLPPAALEALKWSEGGRKLMYNPDIARVFTFDAAERARYGNSNFGTACITARNLVRANIGTRFIQINVGGWDMHANIYGGGLNAANANSLGRTFDAAMGTLIADLAAEGLLEKTLVVAMGEFGRTLGAVNQGAGRDHYLQQAALIAGAGVRGGRAIGSTDDRGGATLEPGWSGQRDIRAEDIAATIYSALGIDWTTIRRDDPSGRGFEYVPSASAEIYSPVHDLWT